MKKVFIILFLFCFIQGKNQEVLGTGGSADIVMALKPIDLMLKKLVLQQAKDFDIYQKMEDYQKKLEDVNKLKSIVINTKTALEMAVLLDQFICITKSYFDELKNFNPQRIDVCIFNIKQHYAFSGFTSAMEFFSLAFSGNSISTSGRLKMIEKAYETLNESKEVFKELK